jgi:hypothetical protein
LALVCVWSWLRLLSGSILLGGGSLFECLIRFVRFGMLLCGCFPKFLRVGRFQVFRSLLSLRGAESVRR